MQLLFKHLRIYRRTVYIQLNLITELLCVKFHKGRISLFSESDVNFMILFLCTS